MEYYGFDEGWLLVLFVHLESNLYNNKLKELTLHNTYLVRCPSFW